MCQKSSNKNVKQTFTSFKYFLRPLEMLMVKFEFEFAPFVFLTFEEEGNFELTEIHERIRNVNPNEYD